MVAIAKHLLWQYHINELGLVPEDTIDREMFRLCRALATRTIQEIETRDDFLRAFRAILERHIQDEKKRQEAGKRGGSRMIKGGRRSASLASCRSRCNDFESGPAGAQVISDDEVESMLTFLDPCGPSLRRIATLSMQGLTNEEIAAELGVSLSTVERRLRTIRSAWKDYDPRLRRKGNPASGS